MVVEIFEVTRHPYIIASHGCVTGARKRQGYEQAREVAGTGPT